MKTLWQEWNAFIKSAKMGEKVSRTYLFILSKAKSVTHLKKMHELLPDNCRLPLHYWKTFKEIWLHHQAPLEDMEGFLLQMLSNGSLVDLYVRELERVIPKEESVLYTPLVSYKNGESYHSYYVNFTADCLGQARRIGIEFLYDFKKEELAELRLEIYICQLEQFTEKLLFDLKTLLEEQSGYAFYSNPSLYLIFKIQGIKMNDLVYVEKHHYRLRADGSPLLHFKIMEEYIPEVVERLNNFSEKNNLPIRNFTL
jgi:hypothetical protein